MQMLRVLWANRSQTAGRGEAGQYAGTGAGAGNHKQDGSPGYRLPNGFWCAKVKVKCAKSDATRADSCHRGEARVTGRERRERKRDRSWADEPAHASATWRMRDIPHSVQAMQYAICHTLLAHVCACPLGHIHIRSLGNPRAAPCNSNCPISCKPK